jgi:hypothetical protein
MRPETKAMLSLLGGGVVVAVVRIALTSHLLRDRSAEALSDLVGCVLAAGALFGRSEERRVGKECRRLCRSRWSPYH